MQSRELPDGSYACLLEATPARIYEQFSGFALAHLFYDVVLIENLNHCISLHTDSDGAKKIMRDALELVKNKRIGMDPQDILGPEDMTMSAEILGPRYKNDAELQRYLATLRELGENAARAKEESETFHAALPKQKVGGDIVTTIPEASRDLHWEINARYNHHAGVFNRFFHTAAFERLGYQVDDGTFLRRGWRSGAANDQLRDTIREGDIPLLLSEVPLTRLEPGDEFRTFALALKALPIPLSLPADEFVSFRNSREVRASLRRFRNLAADLVDGQAPARHVLDELTENYEAYKKQVLKATDRTFLTNVKFVIGTMSGFIEDLVKLRAESFGKRPFEVIEYFMDGKHRADRGIDSPFYFFAEAEKKSD